jgi:uncharacterized protein YprB with RNaseH-like and TPR domain
MTSLADKLKSLGVKVGARNLPSPQPRYPPSLESVLGGRPLDTPFGEAFIVEARYPSEQQKSLNTPRVGAVPPALATWAEDDRLSHLPLHSFAFLDTETTGLAGGTGTYVFLVGAARFDGGEFHLVQFFMRDPAEETALLAALEAFLAPCEALVTFNGKAFDLPLLTTRYLSHGWPVPFAQYAHVDLLHLARRLWRERLPSRTLYNLEQHILGISRTDEDIPGWMIPQMYFDYLTSGDARPLKRVLYHNAMDVMSLAALFNHTNTLLSDPFQNLPEHSADIVALAKLFEELGDSDTAIRLYIHALEHPLSDPALSNTIHHLAMLHKKQDRLNLAVPLWERAAYLKHLHAHIELAKFYEHRLQNFREAIFWTESALSTLEEADILPEEKQSQRMELQHRLSRLLRKAHEHRDH